MKLHKLTDGAQFAANHYFNHKTLRFAGKAGGEDYFIHPDAWHFQELCVRRMGLWYGTGLDTLEAVRRAVADQYVGVSAT